MASSATSRAWRSGATAPFRVVWTYSNNRRSVVSGIPLGFPDPPLKPPWHPARCGARANRRRLEVNRLEDALPRRPGGSRSPEASRRRATRGHRPRDHVRLALGRAEPLRFPVVRFPSSSSTRSGFRTARAHCSEGSVVRSWTRQCTWVVKRSLKEPPRGPY